MSNISAEMINLLRWANSKDLATIKIRGRISGVSIRFVREDVEDLNKIYGIDVNSLLSRVLEEEIKKLHG